MNILQHMAWPESDLSMEWVTACSACWSINDVVSVIRNRAHSTLGGQGIAALPWSLWKRETIDLHASACKSNKL